MAAPILRSPVPKICPRCGAFYQDLASHTCPQCFAKLDLLSDADAAELIAQQEQRARDPEYARLKGAEDEQFKEQSFGACLAVVLVGIAVLVAAIVLLVVASRRPTPRLVDSSVSAPRTAGLQAVLPSDFDIVIPRDLADAVRVSYDAAIALPGTTDLVYHGVYSDGAQVYAVTDPTVTDDQLATLQFAASIAAVQDPPPTILQEVVTSKAHYVVVGPGRAVVDSIERALQQ